MARIIKLTDPGVDRWPNRKRIKISANFYADEILPPQIHNNPRLDPMWFIEPRNVIMIQDMRDYYGPMTINNWYTGGKFYYSGYRHRTCPYGVSESMHRQRIADDTKYKHYHAKDVIDEIINWKKMIRDGSAVVYFVPKFIGMITCVEYSKKGKRLSWAHVDMRPPNKKGALKILKL